MADLDGILTDLCTAPETQIDGEIVVKLRQLIGQPSETVEAGLKSILDECARYSLASDFAMISMDAVWMMAKEEKKTGLS